MPFINLLSTLFCSFLDVWLIILKKCNWNYCFIKKRKVWMVHQKYLWDPLIVGKHRSRKIHFCRLRVNFINMFTSSFYTHRYQKRKKIQLDWIFTILRSSHVKALHKMLMKLTLGGDQDNFCLSWISTWSKGDNLHNIVCVAFTWVNNVT